MRSFASGCTAMTGVEAVSNAVNVFTKPAVKNAQRTLTVIVTLLAVLLSGIAYLARVYHVGAMDEAQPGYQSVISQIVSAVAGRGGAYYVTIGSVLVVLALSANTSFAGFPRLCRLLAQDSYLPHGFGNRGRRLVYSFGIGVLAALAGLLLIVFRGITDRLIPLFAIGAFLAFTMSQAGMVAHWRREGGRHAGASLAINAVGAIATAVALAVILAAKFTQGAWITLLLMPAMVVVFVAIRRHYEHIAAATRCTVPLDPRSIQPPVVVVPIESWNMLAERAVRFALRMSSDVIAVHVCTEDSGGEELRARWARDVEEPLRGTGRPVPQLEMIPSPYRQVAGPLLDYVDDLKRARPVQLIVVVIPELVEQRWYEFLLHNHRAEQLKAALLLHGDSRIVVVTVPWYLEEGGSSRADLVQRPGSLWGGAVAPQGGEPSRPSK
jgi:hypothetical protein